MDRLRRGLTAFALVFIVAGAVALIVYALPRVPARFLPTTNSDEPLVAVPDSGLIRVHDETFAALYDELYDRRDLYYGREIECSGYVLEQEGLAPGAFLIGRDLLWCCETDAYFIGFLAFAEGPPPQPGSTVIVRGRIEATDYYNPENGKTFTVPAIRVGYIGPIEGISKFVYPN